MFVISKNRRVTDTTLPGVFGEVAPLLEHYGYLGVGGLVLLEDFGVPVPGEVMLIAAAVFAGAGQLDIAAVFGVAVLGAIIGDNIGFAIGHFGGRPLAERFGRYVFLTPQRLEKAEAFFDDHGGKVVTIARFIEGLRQVNGVLAGIVGMRWRVFLAYNALGAALWVGVWASVGFFAGEHIGPVYAAVEHYKWYAIAALVVVAVIVIGRRLRHTREHGGTAPQA
jgi:membrane protein DedA with SNARE-associated domain